MKRRELHNLETAGPDHLRLWARILHQQQIVSHDIQQEEFIEVQQSMLQHQSTRIMQKEMSSMMMFSLFSPISPIYIWSAQIYREGWVYPSITTIPKIAWDPLSSDLCNSMGATSRNSGKLDVIPPRISL